MPYPWSANDILTAADLNDAIELAAGGTVAPDADWTDYTPTFTQSATITKTIVEAAYATLPRDLIVVKFNLAATSAGTANNTVLVGLPVAAVTAAGNPCMGYFYLLDASVSTMYTGVALLASTTTAAFRVTGSTANVGQTGGVFTAAIASGDALTGEFHYQAA